MTDKKVTPRVMPPHPPAKPAKKPPREPHEPRPLYQLPFRGLKDELRKKDQSNKD